jgi:hypothetical protein
MVKIDKENSPFISLSDFLSKFWIHFLSQSNVHCCSRYLLKAHVCMCVIVYVQNFDFYQTFDHKNPSPRRHHHNCVIHLYCICHKMEKESFFLIRQRTGDKVCKWVIWKYPVELFVLLPSWFVYCEKYTPFFGTPLNSSFNVKICLLFLCLYLLSCELHSATV